MKWIMLVSGILTSTMIYAAIAPAASLRATFGAALEGPVADVVVRNWGALVALVGGMLVYGAYRPAVRPLVLTVAAASKIVFIALVLAHGTLFLGYQAGTAVLIDSAMVIIFAGYLIRTARAMERPQGVVAPSATAGHLMRSPVDTRQKANDLET
jgi:hypothetical protein